jgi:hypothetical protein
MQNIMLCSSVCTDCDTDFCIPSLFNCYVISVFISIFIPKKSCNCFRIKNINIKLVFKKVKSNNCSNREITLINYINLKLKTLTQDAVDSLPVLESITFVNTFEQVLRTYQLESAERTPNPVGMVYRMNRVPDRPINLCFRNQGVQKRQAVKLP